jgi:hypothetical protein
MTPKKILSIPVYGSGTTLGVIAAILLLPGGLIMAFALGCYWLADRMASADIEDCATIHGDYECDMTIEEYEEAISSDYPDEVCLTCGTRIPFLETCPGCPEGTYVPTPKRCDNCTFGDACLTAASHSCTDWMGEVDVED